MTDAKITTRWGDLCLEGPNGLFSKRLDEAKFNWCTMDLKPIAASLSEQCGATVEPERLARILGRRVEGLVDVHQPLTSTATRDRFRMLRTLITAGDPASLATALELCQ